MPRRITKRETYLNEMLNPRIKTAGRDIETKKDKYHLVAGAKLQLGQDEEVFPQLVVLLSGENCPFTFVASRVRPKHSPRDTLHYKFTPERIIGQDLETHLRKYLERLVSYNSLGGNEVGHRDARLILYRYDKGLLNRFQSPVFDPETFDHSSFPFIFKPINLEPFTKEDYIRDGIKLPDQCAKWLLERKRIWQLPKHRVNTKEKLEEVLGRKIDDDEATTLLSLYVYGEDHPVGDLKRRRKIGGRF